MILGTYFPAMIEILSLTGDRIAVPRRDVLSYLGMAGASQNGLDGEIDECINEALSVITFRTCYESYPINICGDHISLGFAETDSADLAERLEGCSSVILMAATLGIGLDRLISRYSLTEPSRAVILQAVGSAAIEACLDRVCYELSLKNKTRERFSCGYGDLDLSLQRDIFAALGCEKLIGVTLNDSLLMSPSKSVTAIIGVE